MSVAVHIPGSLREFSGESGDIHLTAASVRVALQQLKLGYPGLYSSICDETGSVRQHVNFFVNSDLVPVRETAGLETRLKSGDILTIWTAVSGG